MRKLQAIIQYEMRMQWRRGSAKMALVLLAIAPVFIWGVAARSRLDALAALDDPALTREVTTGYAVIDAAPALILVIFVLPLIAAEVIPLDGQYRVRELLGTLPLPAGTYVAGKLLSVWIPVALVMLAGSALSSAITATALGAYRVDVIAALWLANMIPFALCASGVSILASAGTSSRRRAILLTLVFVPLWYALYSYLFWDYLVTGSVRSLIALDRPEVLPGTPDFPEIFTGKHLLVFVGMVLAVAFSVAWARWQVARQVD